MSRLPTALRAAGPTALAAARAGEALGAAAPELVAGFREHLPAALDVVARRLIGAAYRERLTSGRGGVTWSGDTGFLPLADGGFLVVRGGRYAFGRLEVDDVQHADPALLLGRLVGAGEASRGVGEELTDATVNLAIAYARRAREAVTPGGVTGTPDGGADPADADRACWQLERLATEGHNLHPCGRTRLGWSVADVLAYDVETPGTQVRYVGVPRELHIGDAVAPDLLPPSTVDYGRYAVVPVHPWQLRHLLRDPALAGLLVPLDHADPAHPTAALRTLLVPPAGGALPRYRKLSLDIQVTSTRRTISVASTRNGPRLSRLIQALLAGDAAGERVLLMTEPTGSAVRLPGGRDRDLSAIARLGLAGRLAGGEVPVPGAALAAVDPATGRTVLAGLVDAYATSRRLPGYAAALPFVEEYARLLLPPVLTLATRHGIGIEAHLQNCIPTFVDGVPHRLGLRDLAGLRLYPGRLARPPDLWPGSVIVADTVDVMRAKVAYTAVQAHLGEVVLRLVASHGLDERAAWAGVRGVVDDVHDGLRAERGVAERAAADHAFLTAPGVPHKALLTMRLQARQGRPGDIYVRVENPLR